MKKRRFGREITLKVLYQWDTSKRPVNEILENTLANAKSGMLIHDFAGQLVNGVMGHIVEIDNILIRLSEHWKIERMALVDRNILRLGLYELLYMPETPIKVILNEAIEISKKYGDTNSYRFINGILDHAAKQIRPNEEIMEIKLKSDLTHAKNQ